MNERIKELAVQIGFPMGYDNPAWAYEQDIYKFAELIVRECVHIVLKDALPDWNSVASESNVQCVKIAADLRERFGVK